MDTAMVALPGDVIVCPCCGEVCGVFATGEGGRTFKSWDVTWTDRQRVMAEGSICHACGSSWAWRIGGRPVLHIRSGTWSGWRGLWGEG
jgi:hypothetical protein